MHANLSCLERSEFQERVAFSSHGQDLSLLFELSENGFDLLGGQGVANTLFETVGNVARRQNTISFLAEEDQNLLPELGLIG